MRNLRIHPALVIGFSLLLAAGFASAQSMDMRDGGVSSDRSTVPGGFNGNLDYTGGPNVCGECHEKAFEDWLAHGHSRKLTLNENLGDTIETTDIGSGGTTAVARNQGFRLPPHDPDVYNWDNVLMVIGASKKWKSRFVGMDGFILTKNGMNQYNWETGAWVNYHPDEERPFSCGTCHTTGYDPDGTAFADDHPGIVGDWSHLNITCEACHGPGAEHAAAPSSSNIDIDTSAAQCGTCHTRGDDDMVILASGGFIRHHEQYPEMLNSPHFFLGCTSCHNSHVGRYEGIVKECSECHPSEAAEFEGSAMQLADVNCEDCHMGFATKSAYARGTYEGDVWTHLFRIDSTADYDMFNRDGEGNTTSAKDAISLEFSCFRCHAEANKSAFAGIGDSGTAYHTLGK